MISLQRICTILLLCLLLGCGATAEDQATTADELRIDTETDNALDYSINAMRASLKPEDRASFDAAISEVLLAGVSKDQLRDAFLGNKTIDGNAMTAAGRAKLEGLNYREVIALAQELRESKD